VRDLAREGPGQWRSRDASALARGRARVAATVRIESGPRWTAPAEPRKCWHR